MAKLIPMLTLEPQIFGGRHVDKDKQIKAEPRVAAILTRLNRAREIPEFDVVAGVDFSSVSEEPAVVVKRKRGRPRKVKA